MKRTIKYLIAKLQTELSNEELNSLSIQDLCYALKRKVCFNGRTPKNNPDCASEVYNFFQPYDAYQAKNLIKKQQRFLKKNYSGILLIFLMLAQVLDIFVKLQINYHLNQKLLVLNYLQD